MSSDYVIEVCKHEKMLINLQQHKHDFDFKDCAARIVQLSGSACQANYRRRNRAK